MSWNEIAYMVYLPISIYETVVVGYRFHKHGLHLISDLFAPNVMLAKTTNNLLLVGYYLVNMGWITLSINLWGSIETAAMTFLIVTRSLSMIFIVLAVLHYNNIFWLYYFSTRQHLLKFLTSKH